MLDTIVALATPQGQSAIAVIRLSGQNSISITNSIFKGKNLNNAQSHTIHYGFIVDADKEIDEVMIAVFKAPKTFTTEDCVEISCHGSNQIIFDIISLATKNGARMANPGEFTLRAFLHGRLDLSQSEAVADLIHSSNAKASEVALQQLKGNYSSALKDLRQQLIDFAALIELELDFSEEDVEFANRDGLKLLVNNILDYINPLLDSFKWGNSIKEGIPVAIVGPPNAGKSTLLNSLVNDEKAIVSDIPGTTRDFIEDIVVVKGISFRFIDTAGIRETSDKLEELGIVRSKQKLKEAQVILVLNDINQSNDIIVKEINDLQIDDNQYVIILLNKQDTFKESNIVAKINTIQTTTGYKTMAISAKNHDTISDVFQELEKFIDIHNKSEGTIITNVRHLEALNNTKTSLVKVMEGLDSKVTSDFIALDIRDALFSLGLITGQVVTDDLLESIFSKFCIGK